MMKHSICAVILAGLVTSSASAIDLVWEPTDLVLGEQTEISLYIQANEAAFRYGGGGLGLTQSDGTPTPSSIPDGGLWFDLDGTPDLNPGDPGYFPVDNFQWLNGMEIPPDPDAMPFPTPGYINSIVPPESVWSGGSDGVILLLAEERLQIASFLLEGTEVGEFRLVPFLEQFHSSFNDLIVKEGTESGSGGISIPGIPGISRSTTFSG